MQIFGIVVGIEWKQPQNTLPHFYIMIRNEFGKEQAMHLYNQIVDALLFYSFGT